MIAVHHLHGDIANDGFLYTFAVHGKNYSWSGYKIAIRYKDDSTMQRDGYGTDMLNT